MKSVIESVSGVPVSRSGRPPARILLVTHGYPPFQTGGAELQAQRKARWWSERGDHVRVLTADTRPEQAPPFGSVVRSEDRDGGVSICRLRFRAPDGTQAFADTFRHPLLASEIESELESFQPDLVYQVSGYLFGVSPLQLAAARRIPTVLFAMDFWHVCPRITLLRPDGSICAGPRNAADCAACRFVDRPRIQSYPAVARAAWQIASIAGRAPVVSERLTVPVFTEREQAVRTILAAASLIVVNSRFLARQLSALGVPSDRMLVARQGLDTDAIPAIPRNHEAGESIRALYLGQIAKHKGVDLAVRAVSDLATRGYRITLRVHGQPTGDAAYRAALGRLAESQAVKIGPPLDREALMQALRASDVLIVPSRWYENSPNVILEAFSAGVPVVVASHGGMAEMVCDGVDGLHFVPGDYRSLTEVLQRLCDEPGTIDRLRAGISRPDPVDVEMNAEEAALVRLLQWVV